MTRDRRYWLRLLRLFVVGTLAALALVPLLLGVVGMWALTHPFCNPGGTPGAFGYAFESVSFVSAPRGITLTGYWTPGTNGATIIVSPAYGNGRGGDLHLMDIFHRAGFNVLTYDSRACTAYRTHSLGYAEAEDVQAAFAYLQGRGDVDVTRVSLHGFSSAGATSLMAAARLPAVRGVGAEGNYHDMASNIGIYNANQTFFDTLFLFSAQLTYQTVTGAGIATLSPDAAIAQVAPRPMLFIYGSAEPSLEGGRRMYQKALDAGAPAVFWEVPGAWHGGYIAVARDDYERHLVEFHCAALGGTFTDIGGQVRCG